jgi:hypothetical protein
VPSRRRRDEDELEAHARERIAGIKIPKSVEFRTEPYRCPAR